MKSYYIVLIVVTFLFNCANLTAAELIPPPIKPYREIGWVKKVIEKNSDQEFLKKISKVQNPNTKILVILNEIVGINFGLSKCVGSSFSIAYYRSPQGRAYVEGFPAEKIENPEDRQGYLDAIKINKENAIIRKDLFTAKDKLVELARACVSELAEEQQKTAQEMVDVLSQ